MKKMTVVVVLTLMSSSAGYAQGPDATAQNSAALEQRIRELEDRVIALEGKLRTMQSTQTQPAPAPLQPLANTESAAQAQPTVPAPTVPNEVQTSAQPAQLPVYGGASGASKALNPDISVIGDFIGTAGGNTAPSLASLRKYCSITSR